MRKQLQAPPPDTDAAASEAPLHIKWRPKTLDAVIGQDAVVKSLREALKRSTRPHAFIFTGPSGTGKTTLARIVASMVGCTPQNIIEADAASNSGIDAMRELTSGLRYQGFGESPNRALIVDEAHALSKQAWQALLKPIEEPPAHVYWFLCTTEQGKIPDTIATRCQAYALHSVGRDDLGQLLDTVCDAEHMNVNDEILDVVIAAAEGSPRQALTMLSTVAGCKGKAEAARLLESADENAEVIELCRLLVGGKLTWSKMAQVVKALDMPGESIRIVIANYLAACLLGARSDRDAARLCDMLHPFSKPFVSSDKLAPLLLAFGDLLLGDE